MKPSICIDSEGKSLVLGYITGVLDGLEQWEEALDAHLSNSLEEMDVALPVSKQKS